MTIVIIQDNLKVASSMLNIYKIHKNKKQYKIIY